MSLRFTEAQLQAHQQRIAGKNAMQVCKSVDYDLQQHIVSGLELGTRLCPGSPLIVTLNLGLKALLRDDGKPKPYEKMEQALALLWLECTSPHAFSMTTANPMGGYRPNGSGGQIKGEGAKLGYPDLLMDVPKQGYHGLRIEMKKYSISAKASKEQEEWLTRLASEGYRAVLCRGHQAAIHVFQSYLGLTPTSANYLPTWCIEYY